MFVNGSHPILEASERTTYGDVTKSPVGFLFKWVLVHGGVSQTNLEPGSFGPGSAVRATAAL